MTAGRHFRKVGKHRIDPNQGYVFDSDRFWRTATLAVAVPVISLAAFVTFH